MDRIKRENIFHVDVLLKRERLKAAPHRFMKRDGLIGRQRFEQYLLGGQLLDERAQFLLDKAGGNPVSGRGCIDDRSIGWRFASAFQTSTVDPPNAK